MAIESSLRRAWAYTVSLAKNGYFWGGLAGLIALAFGLFFLVNNIMMPAYTRQDVIVRVPEVINHSIDEATEMLEGHDLVVRKNVQRFNPNLPRDVVVDQSPAAGTTVKPGRFIYVTVNSGKLQMVSIPSVLDLNLRGAENKLRALGLHVDEVEPDPIPSPHANAVTRQDPVPGDSLPRGSSVKLWYSTGLGDQYATVPDVTGLTIAEARQTLLDRRLRSVIIPNDETAALSEEELDQQIVHRQSREPGTRVREGFEIRLFVGEDQEQPPP